MKFYSVKELRSDTKNVCNDVRETGEAIITNNGHPTVLMIDISDEDYEALLRAVRQARAMISFNEMRETAYQNGYLTEVEIEEEISTFRKEKKGKALSK